MTKEGFDMTSNKTSIILTYICVLTAACNPAEPLVLRFIEPMNTANPDRQESHTWFVPTDANQAAGVARLGRLNGRITDVRYSILDRESAFLLRGDLAQGLPGANDPLEGLQLPALAPDTTERTEDVNAFHPDKWSSVRVYDRGLCSSLQSWQSVSQQFAQGFAQEIEDQDGVDGVRLDSGGLTPILRADFPTNDVTPPDDADGLRIHYGFHADGMHTGGIFNPGCNDINTTIDVDLWLEPTDRAYMEIEPMVFALGCRADELKEEFDAYRAAVDGVTRCEVPPISDGRWLDPGQAATFVGEIYGCDGLRIPDGSEGGASQLVTRMFYFGEEIRSDLDAGRQPVCTPDAQLGFTFADSDWRLRARYPLSTLERKDDAKLLLGLSDYDGHALGAHDPLAHIVQSEVGDIPSNDCTNLVRDALHTKFRRSIATGLVLGFGGAIRSAARLDPDQAVLSGAGHGRPCTQNSECNFMAAGGPAFQHHSGGTVLWQGGRHVCQVDQCGPSGQPGICVFQLEPDHLNFRPDGLEVVLDRDPSLEDGSADPQVVVYQALASVAAAADPADPPNECDFRRDGYLPYDSEIQNPSVAVPFAITPVTASQVFICPLPITWPPNLTDGA